MPFSDDLAADENEPASARSGPACGAFAFVLHSHIPYVLAHGQWPHGTDWLTEVAAESYIPLLDAFHELIAEGVSPRVTIGLTPILCEQLADDGFKDEFTDWLHANIGAASNDARTFRASGNTELLALAQWWRETFRRVLHQFENVYDCDLVGAFRALQDRGHIEIITSAATHGYLPLLLTDDSVRAQVKAGVASYVRHFGRAPQGFWMPECAYRPRYRWNAPLPKFQTGEPQLRRGVDEFLSDAGIAYTFVDAHLTSGGRVQGVYADRFGALKALWHQFTIENEPEVTPQDRTPYTPYFIASSGEAEQAPVAVFSRDTRSSHAVWAADAGYPGDEWYLEFHKTHEPGRMRYWRVSQNKTDMDTKGVYDVARAEARVGEHARHFAQEMQSLLREQRDLAGEAGRAPVVTAMYDTELFGHWWREGPQWLKAVIREMARDTSIDRTTCGDYLQANVTNDDRTEIVALPEGSWGEGGFHSIWLNERTVWMWEAIYEAEREIAEAARLCAQVPDALRPLRQAARELLLLQASDWPFVTSTNGAPDYAEARIKAHHVNCMQLAKLARAVASGAETGDSPWRVLSEVEKRDNPFPDINPAWWTLESGTGAPDRA